MESVAGMLTAVGALEPQLTGSLDQGVVHPGQQCKAEEEGHAGAMVDDDNAAMRRLGGDEPEISVRWGSKRLQAAQQRVCALEDLI